VGPTTASYAHPRQRRGFIAIVVITGDAGTGGDLRSGPSAQPSRRPSITTLGSFQVGLANIREGHVNSSAKTSHPNRRGTDLHMIAVADGQEHASTSGRRGARTCRKPSHLTASASPQCVASVSWVLAKRLAQPWVDWLIHAFGPPNNCNLVARQFAGAFTTGTGIDMPDYAEAGCILLWGITLASRRWRQRPGLRRRRVAGKLIIVDPRHLFRGQGRLLAPAARAQTQLLRLPMRRSFNSAVSWRPIRVPSPSPRPRLCVYPAGPATDKPTLRYATSAT
jgi:hypothetical protein